MRGKKVEISSKKMKKILRSVIVYTLLFCFFWYENKHLVTSVYYYYNTKFSEGMNGFRIVQISDLHNARFGKDNNKLLSKIEDLEPDIIAITGDIVDSNFTNINRALEFVTKAVDICPVYYVTGNHEYWLEEDEHTELMDGLNKAGAVILDNESVLIGEGEDSFYLVGIDDMNLYDRTLKRLISTMEEKAVVVLAHEPQYFDDYVEAGADLILTGHAHGGQIRLPFIGGIVAPNQGLLPQYTAGEYFEKDTEMIVSRGLGNSIIPIRLFNCPEIVCVELKSANDDHSKAYVTINRKENLI